MTTLPIPDEALDDDIAIVGKKGGGKSITAKVIVERLLTLERRVLVLDPLGHWFGLRTSADGKRPGFPVAIFGGEHGDLPLDPAAAVPLASVIARENLPAVLDLSDLSKHAQQGFLIDFLRELRRVNTEALTVVLEEADVFAPQQPMGDDSKQLHGEIDWLSRRGRFRGFRLVTVSQRPARLSKDVLTQAATLVAHKLPAPQDRKAVEAWIDGNGDAGKTKEVDATLAHLKVGESWIYSTAHDILGRYRWPMITTLDTSATPKAGDKRIVQKTLAEVDVSKIRAALNAKPKATSEQAEAVLRTAGKTAAEMERLIEAAREEAFQRGFGNGRQAERELIREHLATIGAAFAEDYDTRLPMMTGPVEPMPASVMTPTDLSATLRTMTPPQHAASKEARPPLVTNGAPLKTLNSASMKMFAVLDTNPPVKRSWSQVATLAGLKARGGHFNAGKKALLDTGLVIAEGDLVRVGTPSKSAKAAPDNPAALVEMWAGALSGAAPKILRDIFQQGGTVFRSSVATRLGMQPRGGHWNSAWKELRENGIVITDAADRAVLTSLFMPKGA